MANVGVDDLCNISYVDDFFKATSMCWWQFEDVGDGFGHFGNNILK